MKNAEKTGCYQRYTFCLSVINVHAGINGRIYLCLDFIIGRFASVVVS